ncbi:MAG: hypothetical protein QM730_04615 [Anaerolineales bacterium]
MSQLRAAIKHFWTRDSSILLGGFFVVCILIVYIWWPLAEEALGYFDWNGPWWLYMDWLLLGIFGFMSLTIIARADLKTDVLIVFVGMCGGLAIKSWGTQTNLWHYYTAERPPLWIIPAWPIASLSIDRITRTLDYGLQRLQSLVQNREILDSAIRTLYWLTFASFLSLMLIFVAPTFDKSYTWLSLILCILFNSHPYRLSLRPSNFPRRSGTWILPRTLGHHARMLGLLHHAKTATLCGVGAWNGGGRFLASRFGCKNGAGKNKTHSCPLRRSCW